MAPHLTTFDDKECWLGGGRLRSVGAPAKAEGSEWSKGSEWLRLFQALATPPPLEPFYPFCPLGLLPAGVPPAISLLFAHSNN